MTIYQILHRVDGEIIIEMEAESIYAVPTAFSGDGGMLDFVETLMRSKHAVCQIGQRCGRYNKLVRKDGNEEPSSTAGAICSGCLVRTNCFLDD